MDTAYETQTKKLIRAWTIGKNTCYIKPEEDIFYANPDEIIDYDKVLQENNLEYVEVRYKKGHDRNYSNGKIKAIRPHFFILNKSKYNIHTIPETPEHKKIKDFMWEFFFNNLELELTYSKYIKKCETIYQTIKLKDLNINYENFSLKKEDFFEIGLTDTFNTRRVDLFLQFDKFDPLFGEGLAVEVQLSSQSEERSEERSLDRALKGYSTIWINKKHFIDYKADNLELKNKKIIINSWHSIINNDSDIIADKLHDKIKKYSREFQLTIENIYKKYAKSIFLQEGMLCPSCKVGQLINKTGRNGSFIGCSTFPNCNATYKITLNDGVTENE